MALYSQNMLEIAVELASSDPAYEDLAANFVAHFVLIAHAMNQIGPDGMWDEEMASITTSFAVPTEEQPGLSSTRWWVCYRSAP